MLWFTSGHGFNKYFIKIPNGEMNGGKNTSGINVAEGESTIESSSVVRLLNEWILYADSFQFSKNIQHESDCRSIDSFVPYLLVN